MGDKVKVQEDWLAVCSGCEIAVLDLHEALLDVLQAIRVRSHSSFDGH